MQAALPWCVSWRGFAPIRCDATCSCLLHVVAALIIGLLIAWPMPHLRTHRPSVHFIHKLCQTMILHDCVCRQGPLGMPCQDIIPRSWKMVPFLVLTVPSTVAEQRVRVLVFPVQPNIYLIHCPSFFIYLSIVAAHPVCSCCSSYFFIVIAS